MQIGSRVPENPRTGSGLESAPTHLSLCSVHQFSARHSIARTTETFPMSRANEALEHLRSGKARYRVVLVNDLAG